MFAFLRQWFSVYTDDILVTSLLAFREIACGKRLYWEVCDSWSGIHDEVKLAFQVIQKRFNLMEHFFMKTAFLII